MGILFGPGSLFESLSNPSQWWDHFKNGTVNDVNLQLANQNLQYQKERNAIEDSRYENETAYNRAFAEDERAYNRAFAEDERAYNRAFAEDERAYNRALQQKIFEREDTAIERQAESLSKLGINPLSQSMNGLGAGQAISSSMPSSVSSPTGGIPSFSSRGGQALHNDFLMQDSGIINILSSLLETANAFDNINTAGVQRDSIRSQINLNNAEALSKQLDLENKQMQNLVYANQHGVKQDKNGNLKIPDYKHKDQDFRDVEYKNQSATAFRNENEAIFQKEYGTTDSSNWIERLATGATKQAERATNFIMDSAKNAGKAISEAANNDVRRFKNFKEWATKKINKYFYSPKEFEKQYRR